MTPCAFELPPSVASVASSNNRFRLPADMRADKPTQHGADAGRLERRLHPQRSTDSGDSPKSGVPGNDTFGKSTVKAARTEPRAAGGFRFFNWF